MTEKVIIRYDGAVVISANTHDIKEVAKVINNSVIKRPITFLTTIKERKRWRKHNLCLDGEYISKAVCIKLTTGVKFLIYHIKKRKGRERI
jgi:hypothetical protein